MPSIFRKAGLAAAVVILSYNATLAGPAQPTSNLYRDRQFYSEFTPFGIGPAAVLSGADLRGSLEIAAAVDPSHRTQQFLSLLPFVTEPQHSLYADPERLSSAELQLSLIAR